MTTADSARCNICGEQTTQSQISGYVEYEQHCIRCGRFTLTGKASAFLRSITDKDRASVSGWVYDQNRSGTVPNLSPEELSRVIARPIPSVAERADRLLLEALRGQKKLGEQAYFHTPTFQAATYCQDDDELRYLFKMLLGEGLIERDEEQTLAFKILPQGYRRAYSLSQKNKQSNKGFIAMWFNEEMNVPYQKGLRIAVMDAGYVPVRVDKVEHVNRIDDEVIAQIRQAAFVVADFTGHRGGVYFEAGFALGLDIPVIWTCRKDHLSGLHFDIRQYNTIDWQDEGDLARRLKNRIEAIMGKGPALDSS